MEEARFRAMGSDIHVVVVGAGGLIVAARRRIDELERRWSRFLPDSEVSELTRLAGNPVMVSDDTVGLITRAQEAWRFTGGMFEPLVLGAMLQAGYTSSFETLPADAPARSTSLRLVACTSITVDGNTVTLPAGTGLDAGGIGKGLAADLVTVELLEAGATGACVNMGGDVRVAGASPDGDGWTVAVEHPWSSQPVVNVGVTDGAVATSTTLRRRWMVNGQERHHLIDPRTGQPAITDINLVTVVAGTAWAAEVLAKAVLIRGSAHPFDLIDGSGAQAMIVTDDGDIIASSGFTAFAGATTFPTRIDPPQT